MQDIFDNKRKASVLRRQFGFYNVVVCFDPLEKGLVVGFQDKSALSTNSDLSLSFVVNICRSFVVVKALCDGKQLLYEVSIIFRRASMHQPIVQSNTNLGLHLPSRFKSNPFS